MTDDDSSPSDNSNPDEPGPDDEVDREPVDETPDGDEESTEPEDDVETSDSGENDDGEEVRDVDEGVEEEGDEAPLPAVRPDDEEPTGEEEGDEEVVGLPEVREEDDEDEEGEVLPSVREGTGKAIVPYDGERSFDNPEYVRRALEGAVRTSEAVDDAIGDAGGDEETGEDEEDVEAEEDWDNEYLDDDEFSDFSGQTWDPEHTGEDTRRPPSEEEVEEDSGPVDPETIDVGALFDDPSEANKRTGYDEYPGYVEEQRYWLAKPYSYVVILRSTRDENRIYTIIEPELDEYEEILKRDIGERLRDLLRIEEVPEFEETTLFDARSEVLRDKVLDVVSEYGISKDVETLHRVLYFVERDFIRYGKLDPVMNDPYIEDISCNGFGIPVFVYHREYGGNIETNMKYERQELNSFIIRLAQRAGKHINTANPQVDASLPDGSRAQLSLGEDVTTKGSSFTIRKFKDVPLTPVDLVDLGTFRADQMAYFWLAIENRKSLIFAGGTASGKTTSMNAISLFIPPLSKIVTIEDTRELTLPHLNWIPQVTREKFGGTFSGETGTGSRGEVTMYNLLRAALRQRPEYLLVGEVRGEEAVTLFQAMSTGHTTYSTLHADSVSSVIQRLTNKPIEVPRTMLTSLDIISIQSEREVDGDKVRRNLNISEVGDLDEENQLQTHELYNYNARDDDYLQVGSSNVLQEIRESKGWSEEELKEEIQRREMVLRYLVEKNVRGYQDVTRVLQAFMVDPDPIIEQIQNDELEPEEFKELDSVTV